MTFRSQLPRLLAIAILAGVGIAVVLSKKNIAPDLAVPEIVEMESESPVYFVSHDWIEVSTPDRPERHSILPASAGKDLGIVCSLPNCRNCQIHQIWRASF